MSACSFVNRSTVGSVSIKFFMIVVMVTLANNCVGTALTGVSETGTMALRSPPLPILSPTSLTADAGSAKAYLRWNPQLEDERVIGWKVIQLAPEPETLTPDVLTEPNWVMEGLTNGKAYTLAVIGVLRDGSTTPLSNQVVVTPRDVGQAKVLLLNRGTKLTVGQFSDIELGQYAVKVVFPDGQELVYDRLRPVDWKTRDGEHLIYPRHFGNGLDIGKFDKRGLPMIIPPAGLEQDRITQDDEVWIASSSSPFKYQDVQHGYKHPYITDPLTLSLDAPLHGDYRIIWRSPKVDGNRVTFHYWQPLLLKGYISWNYVLVWETWWPIERDRHGCKYRGLARLIEVQMPEAFKEGYQVMLNNGFGPQGSRTGVISYSSGFRRPTHEVVDFSADKNRQVFFQHPKPPRQGKGYHPNMDCLQSSPLIFYDWGKGSMTVTARGLYWHCANNSSSYIEQGADGVWPNLAWDMAIAGQRVAVDTVEYLYTSDMNQPLPQRYINARFEALGDVSGRMGVQDSVPATAVNGTLGSVKQDGGPVAHAEKWVERLRGTGIDSYYVFHDFWHAVPVTVDDDYRLNENYGFNPQIRAMCEKFHEADKLVGFWFRPEVTKTSIINALGKTIPTAEVYYGYNECDYPDVVSLLKKRGIPLIRQNPHWIRCQVDGSWPVNTPYQWVPMSMASEWWDRVMWPTLWMSKKLGFDWLLIDGGFGGLQGVDYAPMRAGRVDGAVACQPYWWRMFRTMHHIGIRNFGECTLGWKGGFVNLTGPGDEYYIWMYQASCIWGNEDLASPERLHQLYQLYNGSAGGKLMQESVGHVCRYAAEFFRSHGSPDWIELKDLRQGEPTKVTVDVAESPVAGGPMRITKENKYTFTVRPWIWSDVIWHYKDGRSIVYPAYDKVHWK